MVPLPKLLEQGVLHHQGGEIDAATACYVEALRRSPNHPDALHLMGLLDAQQGRVTGAIRRIEDALRHSPKAELYYLNLIAILKTNGDFQAAGRVAAQMVSELPGSAQAHSMNATLCERRGNYAAAEMGRLNAIKLAPRDADLRGELGHMYELQNRLADARKSAEDGLTIDSEHLLCKLVMAKCMRRAGATDKALALLQPAADVQNSAVQFELGQLCDGNQMYAAAWEHWIRGNALRVTESEPVNGDRFLNELLALHELYRPNLRAQFTACSASESRPRVFIAGFPRSGTSLLQQRVSQSTGVTALHEPRTVEAVKSAMSQLKRGYPSTIATMQNAEVDLLTSIYDQAFDAIRTLQKDQAGEDQAGEDPATIRLDTNPQHLCDAALLLRLFPEARFVYIVRHPLDVVLSCLMQNFRLTELTANFVSLQRTAETYLIMMSLWRNIMRQFPHKCHIVKYEDLVQSPEASLAAVSQFMGLATESLKSSASGGTAGGVSASGSGAGGSGLVGTPSYHQVVLPIYKSAVDRWRNYRQQLEPVMELILPWIEYLGYSAE
jgi:Flp pilus assembly protein TadD